MNFVQDRLMRRSKPNWPPQQFSNGIQGPPWDRAQQINPMGQAVQPIPPEQVDFSALGQSGPAQPRAPQMQYEPRAQEPRGSFAATGVDPQLYAKPGFSPWSPGQSYSSTASSANVIQPENINWSNFQDPPLREDPNLWPTAPQAGPPGPPTRDESFAWQGPEYVKQRIIDQADWKPGQLDDRAQVVKNVLQSGQGGDSEWINRAQGNALSDMGRSLAGIKTYVSLGPWGMTSFGGQQSDPRYMAEAGKNERFYAQAAQRDEALAQRERAMAGTESRWNDSVGLRDRALDQTGRRVDIAEKGFDRVPDLDRRKIGEIDRSIEVVDDIAARFNPDEIGPIQGRWNLFARKIGLADPEAVQTAADLGYALLVDVYTKSGKAISVQELKLIRDTLPQMTDNPETFLTLLKGFRDRMVRERNYTVEYLKKQGRNTGEFETPFTDGQPRSEGAQAPQAPQGGAGPGYVLMGDPNTGKTAMVHPDDVAKVKALGGFIATP